MLSDTITAMLCSVFSKRSRVFTAFFLGVFFLLSTTYAFSAHNDQIVRVGFFAFEGYHDKDVQNRRSGYGYEYLHEMAKYSDWVFEYVDGTWEECQEMLKNGKIDLLTSAQYSEDRAEVFDFSTIPLGTSYAQLTVSDTNTFYARNDFASFGGIHIGLLKGNSRNDKLAEFAEEKDFKYTSTLYNTQEELDYALKTGAVDAVLTSSLRKLKNEAIIARFSPAPFYAIVKKGNDALLYEVNQALEAIEMNNPAFRFNLYQEHYRENATNTFVLSRAEKEYLSTKPRIRAVIRPGVEPISYWENDAFKGVAADVMAFLLSGLNLQVDYVFPSTQAESYKLLADGKVDIACLFESDYNLAEQHNTRITVPYIKTNYSLISRKGSNQSTNAHPIIAVAEGGLVGIGFTQTHYPNARQISVASTHEAIEAVANGDADLAIVNVYSVEKEISNYPNLTASFINGEEQQFSIGVSHTADPRLYSILDKKLNSLSSQVFNTILSRHTMFQQTPMNLSLYFRQHPVEFVGLIFLVFALIVGVLLYLVIINRRHAKRVYNLAYVDSLTSLWNINGFLYHGNALLAKNPKLSFVVLAIDLTNFSNINENYGRHVGDKVIEGMGGILSRFSNEHAVVAHADADHFFMLLSYKDQEDIHATLTAIVGMLSSYKINELLLRVRAFIGVGFVEQNDDALLRAIDHASLARNECSSDQPIVYMDKELQSSFLREKDIRDNAELALEHGDFQVFYQPKVDMAARELIGAEALIRWNHSKLGFLSPAEFLPLLEQNGFICEVDFFVLEQACKLIRKWIDDGQKPIVISVNQSRVHFFKSNYIERLQSMIVQYNIPPNHIELEITETLFGQEAISNTVIKKIKSLGLMISIDDFGSGYSSLHLLHQISVDVLKIDKGLLDESGKQEKMRNIIRRVVQIATDLDVDVICEGVETKEQMDFLLGIDCKYAQGFLFSKPLPQKEFELLVKSDMLMLLHEPL